MKRCSTTAAVLGFATILTSSLARADAPPATTQSSPAAVLASHPAAHVFSTFFDGQQRTTPSGPTRRADYLPLIAGNVDYWKNFQDQRGAIIDPYERAERQYSTPAFALAAATLVAHAKRDDLLAPATRAMDWSVWCLANNKTANAHPDFYIPMVMHAHRILKRRVPAETLAAWDDQLRSLIPEKAYRAPQPGGNWNLVNVSGELLRRKDGLVPAQQTEAHRKYIELCIGGQLRAFTAAGMYVDPAAPLAYDAFPRLWLEDALADGAYEDGAHRAALERTLTLGGLSTLLLVSPSGEWPSGGRSAHHQWNEAEVAAVSEMNAMRWQRAGRPDIAGSFKRAAQLALESMTRWQRVTGELWIVKNFADPVRRFGFVGYSFNSQYNLLAVAMLSIAHERADDSIAPMPLPSEAGSYVFDVREQFHHVAAAAGGYYAWIDTAADPGHGSTGLNRVHRAGVDLSPLTDTPGRRSDAGPLDETKRLSMSPGIEWKDAGGQWQSLASFGTPWPPVREASPSDLLVRSADLTVDRQGDDAVSFTIRYDVSDGQNSRQIEERYAISADGVEGSTRVSGEGPFRFVFPALVHDGARNTDVKVNGATLTIARLGAPAQAPATERASKPKLGGKLTWQLVTPEGLSLTQLGPQVVTHNGYVQSVVAEVPAGVSEVKWRLTLEPDARKGEAAPKQP